jgi:membrane protein YqaA with SNARE-associated domain
MKKRSLYKYLPLIGVLLILIVVSFFFSDLATEDLVRWIGIENAYALLFVLAFLSGILTFVGVPYHFVLIALALGGLNPWILGISATAGVMLGDSVSYLIGYYSRPMLPVEAQRPLRRLASFFGKYPRLLPVFFFVYGCIAPYSNDLVGITLGVVRYPFARVMIPLGLGNLVFNTTVALLSIHGYSWVLSVF